MNNKILWKENRRRSNIAVWQNTQQIETEKQFAPAAMVEQRMLLLLTSESAFIYAICIDIMAMLERNLIESYFAKCTSSIRTKAMIGSWNNAKSLRAHSYDRRMQIKHCRKKNKFWESEISNNFCFFLQLIFIMKNMNFRFPFFAAACHDINLKLQ